MSTLVWSRPQDHIFEAGLDRGVLYPDDELAVAWNGLITVEDGGESTIKDFYLDGVKYLSTVSARDWKGSLSAYTYPEEFAELIGIAELSEGLYADSQMPGRFGLSYRTMVSAPEVDQEQHYKIHLLYNVMASLSAFSNTTLSSESATPTEFGFDLTAVPIFVPLHRPTAHFIVDTRKVGPETIVALEAILYGDEITEAGLPTIEDLIALLLVEGVVVVYNGDGTWTATGSTDDIKYLDSYETIFRIDNVDATFLEPAMVYEFNDAIGDLTLSLDEDDIPFVDIGSTGIALLEDVDNVYYWEAGAGGLEILEDEDGIYYVDDP